MKEKATKEYICISLHSFIESRGGAFECMIGAVYTQRQLSEQRQRQR